MPKVLVVDDDRAVLRLVERALSEEPVELLTAEGGEEGMAMLREHRPDVLLLDIVLPGATGIELAKEVRDFDPRLPVIFITVSDDSDTAIEAMKLGAYEYVIKPLGVEQIQTLVERALETRRLMQSPVQFADQLDEAAEGDALVGRCPGMLEVYKQIGRVAGQDVAVLIRGESGTGKELIARAIYQHSHRSQSCFLAVNCAALSDTLLESELFGHEKGAFTGAERRHVGKFEQCSDGTIFLDEIGDMSPMTQSKVLRLLQEQRFERVGGSETIQVNVRMVSATNRNLEEMIEENEFRLDLYHRINSFEIHLPPLRERGDDLPMLIEYFLKRFNQSLSKSISGVSPEALAWLKAYSWPGNIRELQGVLRKAILMAVGPVITPECLPKELTRRETEPVETTGTHDFAAFLRERLARDSTEIYAESVEWMERYLLTRILETTQGNQSQAAGRLGITRGSLRNKLRTLGVSVGQVVSVEDASPRGEDL